MAEKKTTTGHKILSIVGTVLCIILAPILILNLILIVKSYTNTEKVPDVGGYLPLIVLTDSMHPMIDSGDLIICHTIDAKDVKVDDVISFFDPAGNGTSIVTHRVIEVVEDNGALSFRTKGDFNNTEDKEPVPADKLVGIYRTRIAGAGNVALFMQSTAGLIICVVLPIVLLVGYDIIRRRIYEKNKQDDTKALLAELEALKAAKAAKEAKEAVEVPAAVEASAADEAAEATEEKAE